MSDCCDSPAFSSHRLFSTDPSALQIMIYYDDVEVTNPLGSKSKTHKIGTCNFMLNVQNLFIHVHVHVAIFYYSLGNIPPQHRSKLWNIQLLAIVKSTVLVEHGVLEPIMKDIHILERVFFLLSDSLSVSPFSLLTISFPLPLSSLPLHLFYSISFPIPLKSPSLPLIITTSLTHMPPSLPPPPHTHTYTHTVQTGINVEVEGVTHHIKGTITLVSGDNFASQYLGGYKGLSSALRKCRGC